MTQTRGIHVLYVDDEPDFAELAADMLEREDDRFAVETATSASEGLDRLAADDFDCIVSDYDMPGQNGIEFLKTVRDDHPNLPFILYTGKGSEEVASEAISAGVTDYLQKENSPEQYGLLSDRIENAVSQHCDPQQTTELERRLETLSEVSNDILWMFNHDWSDLLYINSAYEDIWGQSTDALAEHPQDFLNGIHPEDRDRVRTAMEQISNGKAVNIEYRVNAEEDYQRWVWVQGIPITDATGTVTRVAGFARDITERKRREQKLRLRRNRFRALFENLGEPVVEVIFEDEEPIIEQVNEPFMETFDINEEVQDENLDDLIVPEDDETAARINERASDGAPIEREVHRGTDELRPFLFRSAPFVGPNGRQRGHGIYIDISERKQRKRELERQNERLEEFASVVSHDLRNPLNVAQGRLELAQDECESDHLADAATAVERSLALVDDLFTLAREGDEVREFEPVNLTDTIDSCWATVETADATLVRETSQTIRADPSRLKQLLENLFRNAVEHGGDEVTVTVGDLDDMNGFYVADDGLGIPDDERDAVFKAGYSTTDEGTGFGLNIVQEIVKAHSWDIAVTDSETGGARFEITGIETAAE